MDRTPRPVRKLPPAVYRRRRIVVGFALAMMLAVGWLAIRALASDGGADATPTATPAPASSASPSASPAPTVATTAQAATIADCTPAEVTIALGEPTVSAEAATFPVAFSHAGTTECLLDGSTDTALLITSGDTRVWKSTDCDATSDLLDTSWLLQPGTTENVEVAWPRQWSFEGCGPASDAPQPGYYYAELTVQGITAERVQFQLP